MDKVIPKVLFTEMFWDNIRKYLNTQSYIVFMNGEINNRLIMAGYGKPGLYMTKYTSLSN